MFKNMDKQIDDFLKSSEDLLKRMRSRSVTIEQIAQAKLDEEIEEAWREHLDSTDWGSGEDAITLTEEMFQEFKENYIENKNEKALEALRG